MGISTHVLDTSHGRPAAGLSVELARAATPGEWTLIGSAITDADGRCRDLLSNHDLLPGIYRLKFQTAGYFTSLDILALYPEITISFEVRDPAGHYHIPLLLSPHTYTTYRGS
jgi:5-hydroxyisourate hydrolase